MLIGWYFKDEGFKEGYLLRRQTLTLKAYNKSHEEEDPDVMMCLGNFIEFDHIEFKMPYKDIFKKCSIGGFRNRCRNVLGNYDDKLVKAYLL